MDVLSIANLADLNPVAKNIVADLGKRLRLRRKTNIPRYQRHLADQFGSEVDEAQLVDTFKKMESLGLGSLVNGRGGKPSRFVWKYSLRDVAKAARGEIKPEEMSLAPTGKTRIVRSTKPKVKVAPAKPIEPSPISAPITQSQSGTEILVIGPDGHVKKFQVTPDKEQAFLSVLQALGTAK